MTDQETTIKAVLTIVGTEQKTSPKSSKTFLQIKTQAQGLFSCWDVALFDKIPTSGLVAVEYKANGDFRNVVAVSPQNVQPNPGPLPVHQTTASREWSITRQTALKAAVDFCARSDSESPIDQILSVAHQFHEWLLADPDEPF